MTTFSFGKKKKNPTTYINIYKPTSQSDEQNILYLGVGVNDCV